MIYFSEWRDYSIASSDKGVCYLGNAARSTVMTLLTEHYEEDVMIGPMADDKNHRYLIDMERYFDGSLQTFDWKYDLRGTPFQQQVWQQLLQVPYGETVTYGEIAERLNKKSAVRAVGGAIGRNPVMIAIPCHRVIGKNGRLTGFSGGLHIKRQLLDIEGISYAE
jgi:O-6-methylguanine DNA methyltransferase